MYDEDLITDIALIKQKSEFIETMLENHILEMKEFRNKFSADSFPTKKQFEDHVKQNRYVIGLLLSILLAILVKLVIN